MIHT